MKALQGAVPKPEINEAVEGLFHDGLVEVDGYPNGPLGMGYCFDTITLTRDGRQALAARG